MKEKFDDLSLAEMIVKRKELLERWRKLRFDKVIGHVESPIEIRTTRRSIARLNTKIHQQSKANA
ncbi:50S ribosomal protein L29 [Candidatus Haliotispira prima]|uniref:Large ribosomal subunit protein uL29 n=1 Tax=Candidatus Haliotispira prima TaxID=3034016 RepID=A0ABY8MHW8_9SPIO|nr:50S ribosomal protein L29 [Candidatus Haliotispira prima]